MQLIIVERQVAQLASVAHRFNLLQMVAALSFVALKGDAANT